MTILISLGMTFAAVGVTRLIFDYRVPGWAVIVLYGAFYWVVSLARRPKPEPSDEPDPDYSYLPTSGPIGRFGQRSLLFTWFSTQLLCILNPFQLVQIVKQIVGNKRLDQRERETGDDGTGYQTKAEYTLPFEGDWFLYNGGMTPKTSHSWDVLGQRFALDFVKVDDEYRRHTGRGTKPAEYFCFAEPILSAAAGKVVHIENRVRLAPFLGWGVCDFTARHFAGNHVIVEHAEGEFGVYAHLIRDSIRVSAGDDVRQGQQLGSCGHNGHSSEPHLHFHLQDSADFFNGMGLPIRFSNILVDGENTEEAYLTAGNRVCRQNP